MNNKKLFKTILITLLIFIGLTWVIKTGTYSDAGVYTEGDFAPYGILNIFKIPLEAFQTFSQYGVYLLVLGGFYGILKKTNAYNKIISNCSKFNRTGFMIFTITILGLFSSLFGIPMCLFALVPFFKDVLETMGYDKKNAMLATVGSIFIGIIGSTFSFEVNGYINYFYEVGFTSLLGYKIGLLVVLLVLLALYVIKSNKKFNAIKLEYDEKVNTVPAIILGIITIVIGIVGMYSWYYTFGITFFDDLHTSISNYKIGNFSIISNILGQNLNPIGKWSEVDFAVILLISSFVIAWTYGLKLKDMVEGFISGASKLLPMSIFVTLSFVIFIPLYTSSNMQSIFYTIFDKIITLAKEVSIIPMTLLSVLASTFYGQFIYFASDLSAPLMAAYETGYPLMTFIMQTVYGLTLFVAPTSMLLLGSLSYFDISYKEWMKYVFKFLLIALLLLVLTFLIIGWVM